VRGLILLDDGVTVEQVRSTFAKDPESIPTVGRIIVGTGSGPGASATQIGIVTRAGVGAIGCVSYSEKATLAVGRTVRCGP